MRSGGSGHSLVKNEFVLKWFSGHGLGWSGMVTDGLGRFQRVSGFLEQSQMVSDGLGRSWRVSADLGRSRTVLDVL